MASIGLYSSIGYLSSDNPESLSGDRDNGAVTDPLLLRCIGFILRALLGSHFIPPHLGGKNPPTLIGGVKEVNAPIIYIRTSKPRKGEGVYLIFYLILKGVSVWRKIG